MSLEWTSTPLSIQSIASQYTLPVVVRSALGFRGSSRPFVLHSISRITFAFGRALRTSQSKKSAYQTYRPIHSEVVAVPLQYPGYFECLSPSRRGPQDGIIPEKSIRPIVDRLQADHRPQAFYIAAPMRVYTFETSAEGTIKRLSHQIEAHQMILFDKLIHIEYTPTEDDNLTAEDYEYSWWICFGKHILKRNEHNIECILSPQQTCYIPCSSTDEVSLIPVGQRGSNNLYKLQTIQNLVEQFPLPINIKLAQLPSSYTYEDFNGNMHLIGSRTEEFAVCASLSSTNISVIPTNTPLKFVVASLSTPQSTEIKDIVTRCQMFVQSFDMQIRRLLISSNDTPSRRSRPRNRAAAFSGKRTLSADPRAIEQEDPSTTDEGYRSEQKQNNLKIQKTISMNIESASKPKSLKRASSIDNDSAYNSLVHPVRSRMKVKQSSSTPPPLPQKPANYPYPFTYDSGSNLIEKLDLPNADGAILMDSSNELFLALASDSRFS